MMTKVAGFSLWRARSTISTIIRIKQKQFKPNHTPATLFMPSVKSRSSANEGFLPFYRWFNIIVIYRLSINSNLSGVTIIVGQYS